MGWSWKESVWRGFPSVGVGNPFLGVRKQEEAALLGTPRRQGRRGAEQSTGEPRRFCK